jgi:hypothetical protein
LPPAAATLFDAIVQIERFDGATDADRLLSCYRIAEACHAVDQPDLPAWSIESFTAKWAYGFDSSPRQSWLGTDDSGKLIGCYLLTLPEHDKHCPGEVPPECGAAAPPDWCRHSAARALRGSGPPGPADRPCLRRLARCRVRRQRRR